MDERSWDVDFRRPGLLDMEGDERTKLKSWEALERIVLMNSMILPLIRKGETLWT